MPNDDDGVQIVIGGVAYQDWYEVDIDSNLFEQADAFSVSASIPAIVAPVRDIRAGSPRRPLDSFREGEKCDVNIGGDRQMSGVIDDVEFTGERTTSKMRVLGRDKAAYLVDSEAKHIKANDYNLKTLVEALLDPSFGIKNVIFSNEENRKLVWGKKDKRKPKATAPKFLQPIPRKTTKIDCGQRLSSILDVHTKRLGLAWWMTAAGDLFIGKPNYKQEVAYLFQVAAVGSRDAQSNNVESWSIRRSMANRYSEVKVSGQGWQQAQTIWQQRSQKPTYEAFARDPDLVKRGIVKKMIFADGDILSNEEAQSRVDYDMGMHRLSGLTINLTVEGFRSDDKRIYAVDTLAAVKIEEADLDGIFYVTQRRFTETRGRRRTSLTLHEKDVWLP